MPSSFYQQSVSECWGYYRTRFVSECWGYYRKRFAQHTRYIAYTFNLKTLREVTAWWEKLLIKFLIPRKRPTFSDVSKSREAVDFLWKIRLVHCTQHKIFKNWKDIKFWSFRGILEQSCVNLNQFFLQN